VSVIPHSSRWLPEVKAAPGVSAVFWLLFVSRRAARCRAGTVAHVYAHRLARLQEAGLVRLTTQETRERMLHARANVHAAPELVA
jgi:hypothetical protein